MNLVIHLIAGILLAGAIALIFNKLRTKQKFYEMCMWFSLANLIDLDHLLVNPIYNPLHSWFMFPFYTAGLFYRKTRYLSIGLILHLALDLLDCILTKRYFSF